MTKKVFFIGSGYECVKFVFVEAETNREAFQKAMELYRESGWNFHYNELEIADFL